MALDLVHEAGCRAVLEVGLQFHLPDANCRTGRLHEYRIRDTRDLAWEDFLVAGLERCGRSLEVACLLHNSEGVEHMKGVKRRERRYMQVADLNHRKPAIDCLKVHRRKAVDFD